MTLRPRNIVLAAVALVVAGVAGGFLYFLLSGESAPAPADVPERVSGPVAQTPDGRWAVLRGSGTYAGYRVQEEYLSIGVRTAVGRTHGVAGTVDVAGGTIVGGALRADLAQLVSDQPGRDDALRTRGIQTDAYPRATFTLDGPLRLSAADATAPGTLTLHGRRAAVRVTARAARVGDRLVVAGRVPVGFARFGIEPPSKAGVVTVRDHGVLEFRLVLARPATPS
jgi:polyisoprenoid-binding protein YceI